MEMLVLFRGDQGVHLGQHVADRQGLAGALLAPPLPVTVIIDIEIGG
jgi:hypothetical protein